MKVLVSCANGAGTSLMMKMKVEKALKELDIKIDKIHHCSISEGKSTAKQFDVVFCSANFVDMFKDAAAAGVTVIGMKNILSVDEAKTRIQEAGLV
ncbi:PTS sugar transporter subunit IIB [Suttonella ornithocola]|uniref:Ascorbate-specific phosphotransferase enzyme IIB component n=1 Tax=Suttonella ornithocola TaxID=279832 RepID=A0A380MLR9_9GAMM|nr:PTS sugar transporter subunit IIB [Suttonella ornithocola]SUO93585.1 Ascorbate-specific phosphotransferase enzyme IIB component [Suttonella ornithocola]